MRAHCSALALAVLAAGCTHSVECTDCGSDLIYESEINDSAPQANWMGSLYPGDALQIEGHITQWGYDQFDGFAFLSGSAVQIEVRLWADDPHADLDLCVWDPMLQQFVVCFETSANPEGGVFAILEPDKEFHLVVRSYTGDSSYHLEVFGSYPSYAPESAMPAVHHREGAASAWDAYAPVTAGADLERGPVPAMLVTIDEQGELIEAVAARILPLDRP
jgi:hypothetical protein